MNRSWPPIHRNDSDYRPPREYRRDQAKYALVCVLLLAAAAWLIFGVGGRVIQHLAK